MPTRPVETSAANTLGQKFAPRSLVCMANRMRGVPSRATQTMSPAVWAAWAQPIRVTLRACRSMPSRRVTYMSWPANGEFWPTLTTSQSSLTQCQLLMSASPPLARYAGGSPPSPSEAIASTCRSPERVFAAIRLPSGERRAPLKRGSIAKASIGRSARATAGGAADAGASTVCADTGAPVPSSSIAASPGRIIGIIGIIPPCSADGRRDRG